MNRKGSRRLKGARRPHHRDRDDQVGSIGRLAAAIEKVDFENLSTRESGVSRTLSLGALLISIAVGVHAIYSALILEPRIRYEADVGRLRASISEINDLNYRLVEARATLPQEKVAGLSRVANSRKLVLLDEIHAFISLNEDFELGFAEYSLLANEHLTMGNTEIAYRYAQSGAEVASTPLAEAVARLVVAQARYFFETPDHIEGARQSILLSLDLAKSQDSFASLAHIANVYLYWIIGEIFFGDCERAVEAMQLFQQETEVISRAGPEARFVLQQIKQQASGQTECRNHPYW